MFSKPAPPMWFAAAKTRHQPIPVRNRHVRDALLIAALDPAVWAIREAEPLALVVNGVSVIHRPDALLHYAECDVVLDVHSPTGGDQGAALFAAASEAVTA